MLVDGNTAIDQPNQRAPNAVDLTNDNVPGNEAGDEPVVDEEHNKQGTATNYEML